LEADKEWQIVPFLEVIPIIDRPACGAAAKTWDANRRDVPYNKGVAALLP
jgi:hypothetical protein